ncbi:MAG TPA: class II aldolase/adducin family protein [Vineibacter sp.]|nr:class II aldolase/adducin family protein [Vineibacter sp.]
MSPVAAVKSSPSVRDQVSREEWDVRTDLAALYRVVAHYNWTDLIFTHISARVPGPEDHFLINPYGMMFHEITASSLLKVDHEGNILLPSPYPFNRAGFVIHGAVHMGRPDVQCVIHLHTKDGVAVAAQKDGLLPLSQHAMFCLPFLAYHDYEGVALNMDERHRLIANLGDKKVMLLRNHGTLAAGTTIADAWMSIHNLERACTIQIAAMAGGAARLNMPSQAAIDTVREQVTRRNVIDRDAEMNVLGWNAMLRMMDAKDPSYRN